VPCPVRKTDSVKASGRVRTPYGIAASDGGGSWGSAHRGQFWPGPSAVTCLVGPSRYCPALVPPFLAGGVALGGIWRLRPPPPDTLSFGRSSSLPRPSRHQRPPARRRSRYNPVGERSAVRRYRGGQASRSSGPFSSPHTTTHPPHRAQMTPPGGAPLAPAEPEASDSVDDMLVVGVRGGLAF